MSVVKELVNLLERFGDNSSITFSIDKTIRSLCLKTMQEIGSDRYSIEHYIALRVVSFQDPKPDVRLTETLQAIIVRYNQARTEELRRE